MKHKRLLTWILAAVMVLLALTCLVACGDDTGNTQTLKGTATVVVGEKTYTVNFETAQFTDKNTAFNLLTYLADNEEGFTFDCSFSGYGAFVNSIGDANPTEDNQYVALFVSDEAYKDTSAYALPDKTVNGVTYYYSGVGISAIKLADGLSVLFCLETF